MPGKNLFLAAEFAKNYDVAVTNNGWVGPEIIFGLVQKYIQPNQNLLDIGIGTGASSLPFKNLGLQITGLDGSPQMLNECHKKNIAQKLVVHDLEKQPLPFVKNAFDIILSNAVFHLIYPFEPLFSEIGRICKTGGLFIFTFENAFQNKGYVIKNKGVWETQTPSGVVTYKYSKNHISTQLKTNGFRLLKQKRFLAFYNKEFQKKYFFTAILAEKS